jgi:hypothetical protein
MFLQVQRYYLYGCEDDWFQVESIMYDMMVGLNREERSQYHRQFPADLTKDAVDILGVSCSSALPVSVMVSLFTILQQS